VRFERDAGDGFTRVFPETFGFRPDRHDPAELYLQLDDLLRKPRLLSPRANRRDAEVLISRLVLGVPRYLERVVTRLEVEGRLEKAALTKINEDVALIAQIFGRFVSDRSDDQSPGIRMAAFHLRKLAFRSLLALVERRVDPAYLAAYVAGSVDLVDPADDLSEAGFFYTMESGEPQAVNRCLVRLAERAFYRWLEEVCLDEDNRAFGGEDSPFEDRESEVLRAISRAPRILRGRDLIPFLRRPGNRDCLRVLGKLEAWFLRQYDVHHAAAMIHHADQTERFRCEGSSVLSRHTTRNYLVLIGLLASPYVAGIFAYARAPAFFDAVSAGLLVMAAAGILWFFGYRFCWQRDLTFFRASVPRIAAGIIVGYLPIFFIDEVWDLATRSGLTLACISLLLGFTTLLYLYVEVQRRLGTTDHAFARARQIFLLGVLQSFGIGVILTGLIGRFMVLRNWSPASQATSIEALRAQLPPFVGQLPAAVGIEPFYAFPSAIFVMTFMSFFIGTFLQLMWEDIPITQPL
jgi:AraC-like DNA-binding protein